MTIAHQASRQTPEDKRRSDEGERAVFVDREPKLREDGSLLGPFFRPTT